jgi:uncharacterized protein (DUF362 family)
MDRREFLRRLVAMGAAGAALLLERGGARLWAAGPPGEAGGPPDLAAVKGSDPIAALDRGLKELGGMGAFVRRGQSVVIKPNIGWDTPPGVAATTNPMIVKRLVEHCIDAGARKVWVFDHSCDSGPRCYANSQIERYAKQGGAEVVSGESSSLYHEAIVPGALRLKKVQVHELILEADVFINAPILKNHSGAGMTCAMKNLMGIVWDRGEFHRSDLDQCIADSCLLRRPTLNVVEAWKVMLSGGPRGNAASRYSEQRMLILSSDIVAADAAAAKVLGGQASGFGYIAKGEERGLGSSDLSKLKVSRLTM